jgi:glycosyltransferase involved in cell wall biosynthesis
MQERLQVALVNSLYPPTASGGAEQAIRNLAEALARSGHRVSVIALSPDGGSVERLSGVTVVRLPTDVPWPFGTEYRTVAHRVRSRMRDRYSATMYARVRSVLSELRPDVMHTHSLMGFSVSAWDAATSLDVPIVHTAHDWYLTCVDSTMVRAGRNCAGQCTSCAVFTAGRKAASGRVAAFVGVSDFVRDLHLGHGFFGKAALTTVIHNPSPPPQPTEGAPARRRDGELRLGFLGRIDAVEGIETLLATLRPVAGSFTLKIGGAGNDARVHRLKGQYADDRFEWLGEVDPRMFFGRIDALVVPSTWNEPSGRVIAEAHSHGIPVIASRRGAIPEIVRDGVDGFLYEPERPHELADIVQSLLNERAPLLAMSTTIMARQAGLGVDEWASAYAGLYRTARRHVAPALAAG